MSEQEAPSAPAPNVETVTLDPSEVEAVKRDDAHAAEAAYKAAQATPPPPPQGDLPSSPSELAQVVSGMKAGDVEDLLVVAEGLGLFPEKGSGSLWYAPDDAERKKLSPPLARVLSKWLPSFLTSYPDEAGLALALLVIAGGRMKLAREEEDARRAERRAAPAAPPSRVKLADK